MEKYHAMPSMQMPYSPPAPMPSPIPTTLPASYAPPVMLHASFEETNIYPQVYYPPYGGHLSVGPILVLYILLVIILRGICK